MINITLQSLSREMNITIFELIKNFSNIGIIKKKNDYVSLQEKKLLLHYLSSKNELSFHTIKKKNQIINSVNSIAHSVKKNADSPLKKKYIRNNNLNKMNNKVIIDQKNILNEKKDIIFQNNDLSNKKILVQPEDNKNVAFHSAEKRILNNNFNTKIINYKKNSGVSEKKNKTILSHRKIIKKTAIYHHAKEFFNPIKRDDIKNVSEYKDLYNKNDNINNQIFQSNLQNKKYDSLQQSFIQPKTNIIKNIIINRKNSISDLSNQMAIKSTDLVKKILDMGHAVTINQVIDQETAQLIVEEMGHKAVLKTNNILEKLMFQEHELFREKSLKKTRPPVVTVMGHVDHGKTSLLDYIRSTQVAKNESGGITQHIGAYYVSTKHGIITFLDTPGHAAFTAMRSRGTQITDIVVLVVAGDDGVKPQTIEAIQHAKLAKVPILVAINKIDKKESNPEKIKKELMKYDILPEEWGGETIVVNISSITGQGIDDLLHSILLQSEILELSAVPSGLAHGVVIEARLDKHRGPIATALVQSGEVKKGDIVLCGLYYGKIRTMKDSFGFDIKSSGPSIPIEISGLSGIPTSGDAFYTLKNEKQAREIALYRNNRHRDKKLLTQKEFNVNNMFNKLNKNNIPILNIILKSDVKGSLEAVSNAILNLSNSEINIKIISSLVGDITETDVSLAVATHAIIIGFNVHTNILAKRLLKIENVDVRHHSVIYHVVDTIKSIISNMITPKYKKCITGSAEIRDIFKPTKSIFIAGCMVTHGIIKRKYSIHVIRNNKIIYKGELESLRRFKEDVKEVSVGKECGIGIKNYNGMCIGDIIESVKLIEIKNIY